MKIKINLILLWAILSMTLAGCSFKWEVPINKRDPYEKYNKKIYNFNNDVYEFLTPVANAYAFVMPNVVQNGIFNVFQNLFEPSRVANDIFQWQWGYAGDDTLRFVSNTTLGVAGIFDVANSWFDLPIRYHQDFATTLHKWGVYKKGYASPYIVWPFFGPGTVESLSNGVDAAFNPLSYLFLAPGVGTFTAYAINYTVYGLYYTNQGVSYLPAYSSLQQTSLDPYVALRNAYIQNYDYSMAQILKQKLPQSESSQQNDQAVLNILGVSDKNASSEVASSGESFITNSQNVPVLKSSLSTVNDAAKV
ncbi:MULTISPECIES: MlaA family lipoprotein [unclassified Francisella]|uniref:MlaA family lipoprotein n=1 Tax=unclassified Francisella TaxID=2610885 RepID=UPI002E36C935|nr:MULTISPECIES: VacJ family lipoprotein [unclassified Francisella]MED7819296.1 VacJ family lipoprotein [Francisella sp. 19S2-4]MED7830074.1 VacJ family lipoprotein [Francisella sp. 19S2-10]